MTARSKFLLLIFILILKCQSISVVEASTASTPLDYNDICPYDLASTNSDKSSEDIVSASVTRRQYKEGFGNGASATFDSAPLQGSLLVVVAGHRKSDGDNSISGSGWVQHIYFDVFGTDTNSRRGMAVWTKIAGANEPSTITTDVGNDISKILIQEFSITGGSFTSLNQSASNQGTTSASTSITTGTTATTTSANTLVIGAMIGRYSAGNTPNFLNGLHSSVGSNEANTSSNYPTMWSGYVHRTTTGTQSSTASYSSSIKSSAAIIAYGISVGSNGGAGTDCSGRVSSGLIALYDFSEGTGNIVNDISGYGTPLDLTIANTSNTSWLSGDCGIDINSSTIIQSSGPATKIHTACTATNELTVEVWAESSTTGIGGPARLVAMGSDGPTNQRNFCFGPDYATEYESRIRTTSNVSGYSPPLNGGTPSTNLHHYVVTRSSSGLERFYIDGSLISSQTIGGNFSNWDSTFPLAIANRHTNLDRQYLGNIYKVAIYNKDLSASEVSTNYNEGQCCSSTGGGGGSNCNFVNNPEFDSGTSDWILSNSSSGSSVSTLSIDNTSQLSGTNSAKIAISNGSNVNWHIQLYQNDFTISSSKIYNISFKAKAASNRSIGVIVQLGASPWSTYYSSTQNITTSAQTYTLNNISMSGSTSNARFAFLLGNSTSDVWIDDVVFEEVGCSGDPNTFTCDDGLTFEHYAKSCSNGSITVTVPNTSTVNKTIIEVVYKGCDPGSSITVGSSIGNITLNEVVISGGSTSVYVYRAEVTGGVTNLTESPACGSCSSGWGLQSLIAYVERDVNSGMGYSTTLTEQSSYCDVETISIAIPTSSDVRDVEVVLPISEVTDDGRYLTVVATSNTGSASATETIYGSDPALGDCCLNVIELTIPNVPANSTAINISIITDAANNPNGSSCGQSWVVSGTVYVANECPCENLTSGGTIGSDESKCGSYDPAIMTNVTLPSGGLGSFIEYQWQQRNQACGGSYGSWTTISGATSSTYNPPTIGLTTQYRRGAKRDACGPYVYSNVVTKEVVQPFTNAGTIGNNESLCGGYDPANIISIAAPSGGCGGTITYLWQTRNLVCGGSWSSFSNIPNSNTATYNPPAITTTTRYRRLSRRGTCSWAYSSEVIKEVVEPFTSAGTIGNNESLCGAYDPANIVNLTTPSGGCGTITYMWQKRDLACGGSWSSFSNIANSNSATYNPGTITKTTRFRRLARRGTCSWIYSSEVIKEVIEQYTNGGTIAGDESLCGGYNPGLITSSVAPSGGCGPNGYAWQKREQPCGGSYGTWSNISGANAVTYNPPAITMTTQYRRVANRVGGCTPAYILSNNVTKTVIEQYTSAGTIAGNQSLCGGYDPANITSSSLGTGGCGGTPSYLWQTRSLPCGGSYSAWSNISGAGAATYNPPAITITTQYRRLERRTSGCSPGWLYSTAVTKEVVQQTTDGGDITGDELMCGGYDPGVIGSTSPATGGCGGTIAYYWGVRTVYCDGTKSAYTNFWDGETHDPGPITETKEYIRRSRRISGCSPSWTYSNIVIKEVVQQYTGAGSIAGNETMCGSYNPAIITSTQDPVGGCRGTETHVWQQSEFNCSTNSYEAYTNISGASATTYDPPTITVTTKYRRVSYRNNTCTPPWVISNEVIKTVIDQYTDAGTIAGDESQCDSYNPSLITSTTGPTGGCGGTNYSVWQKREYNCANDTYTSWSTVSGITTLTYDPPSVITVTTQYRRLSRRYSGCSPGWAYSAPVTKEVVIGTVSGGTIAANETVCATSYDPALITSSAEASGGCGGTLEYRWYKWERLCNTTSWSSGILISGATGLTYDPPVITLTTRYRRYARRASDCSATNGTWMVSNMVYKYLHNDLVDPGTISADQEACGSFTPAILTGTAPTGGCTAQPITYLWQYRFGYGGNWTDIANSNSQNYQPVNSTVTGQYRRKVISGNCGDHFSNIVTLTVNELPTASLDNASFCPSESIVLEPEVCEYYPDIKAQRLLETSGWYNQFNSGGSGLTGDGSLCFDLADASGQTSYQMIGLTTDPFASTHHSTIDYAMYVIPATNNYRINIYENGSNKGNQYTSSTSYIGSTFCVRRTGTTIEYLLDGTVVYTSLIASTGTLFFDNAFHSTSTGQYSEFENIKLCGDASDIGMSYSWSGGGSTATKTVSSTGTYTVTVTDDHGCQTTASATVTQDTPPNATLNKNRDLTCAFANSYLYTTAYFAEYPWTFYEGTSYKSSGASCGSQYLNIIGSSPYSALNQSQNPISASTNYDFNFKYKKSGSGAASARIIWYTNAWTYLSVETISLSNNTTWTDLTVSATSPATAGIAIVQILTYSGAVVDMDCMSFKANGGSELLEDPSFESTSPFQWSGPSGPFDGQRAIYVTTPGTYNVTVTDPNTGCTATSSIVVNQDITPPNATATNDGPLTCANTSVTLIASSTTSGATYNWSNSLGTNTTATVSTPGTYTVTVTDPSNGCTATASTTVAQNNTPTTIYCERYRLSIGGVWGSWVNFNGNCDIEICEDDGLTDFQFDGGPDINTGWVWKDEDGITDAEVDEIVLFSNIGLDDAGTYTGVLTDANGCVSNLSFNVIVNPNPNVSITQNGPITCSQSTVTLTANPSGMTYAWSGGGTAQTKTVTTPGTYTVTVTSNEGCTSTNNIVVTEDTTAPNANAGPDQFICGGDVVNLTASGGGTYYWSNGATTPSITVSPTSYREYHVTVTAPNGCTDTDNVIINVEQPTATPVASPDEEICPGESVVLSVNEDLGTGGILDYSTWTTGTGSTTGFNVNGTTAENHRINANDPWGNNTVVWEARPEGNNSSDGGWNTTQFSIDHTKTYRYSVWVNRKVLGPDGRFYLGTNGYGSVNGIIQLSNGATNTNPYFEVSANPPVYGQDRWVLVVGHVYPSGHSGSSLHPDSGVYATDVGYVEGTSTDYKWLPQTTHSIHRSYLYYSSTTTPRQQWVYPRVDLVDGSEPSIDDLLNGYDANAGLGDGANWFWYTGSCGGTLIGSGTEITVTPSTTTTYFVRGQGNCNNSDCDEVTVTVNTPPVATASNDGPLTCATTSVTLTATPAGMTYAWSGGGTSQTKVITAPGTYTVTVTDSNGCTDTASTIVTENTTPTNVYCERYRILPHGGVWSAWTSFGANCEIELCELDGLTDIQVDGGPNINTGWVWEDEDGNIDSEVDEQVVFTNIDATDAGTYTATLTNSIGCISSFTFEVIVAATATAATSGNQLVCVGETATLTSSTTGGLGTPSYQWQISANNATWSNISGATGSTYTTPALNAKTYYRLIVSWDGLGCDSVTSAAATVDVDTESIALTADAFPPSICPGGSTVLTVNDTTDNGGILDYSSWTVGTGGISGQYNASGTTAENHRLVDNDPWGHSTVVWEAQPEAGTGSDGGWNSVQHAIDHTKSYRFSVWVNREIVGSSGRLYFGTNGYGSTNGLKNVTSGTTATNNYFYYTASPPLSTELPENEWVLMVGHIYPSNHTGTTNHPESGRYTANGGKIGNLTTDFQWLPQTDNTLHRTFLYNCDDVSVRQKWVYPRLELLDGTEPSIDEMLGGFDVNGGLGEGANWEWYTGSCGGTSVGTGKSITVSPSATTTYYVRGEGGDCSDSDCATVTVTVNTPPTASASNDGNITCADANSTMTALPAGMTYAWSGGGTSQTKTVTVAGTYTVTVTDANGCTDTAQTTVGESITPTTIFCDRYRIRENGVWSGYINFTGACEIELCENDGLSDIEFDGGPNINTGWVWQDEDNIVNGNVDEVVIFSNIGLNDAGTYTGELTDANGCISNISFNVIVNPNPDAGVTSDGPLNCDLAVVTMTATPAGMTYAWSGGGTGQTKTTVTPGTYTVTVTDANGCSDVASVTVTQNITDPNAGASNDGPLTCANTSVILTATSTTTGATYAWSGGGSNATKTVTNPGTYTVTVTDPVNGCTTTAQTIVIQNIATPTVVTSANQTICTGGNTTISASANGGSGSGYSYNWNQGLGAGASHSITVNATTTYTVTVTDSNGCTDTDAVTISVVATPQVSITVSNATICQGETTIITSNVTGGTGTPSYQWQQSAHGNIWTDISGATSANYTTNALTASTLYRLTVNYSGAGCAIATSNEGAVTVETESIVVSATTDPEEICLGGSAVLTVNGPASNGGEIDYSTWTTGTGTTTGFNIIGSAAESNRINDTDPWGNTTVVWENRPDAVSGPDGGWNSTSFPIDNSKLYRYSFWVNRKIMGNSGRVLFGTGGYGSTNGVEIIANGNTSTNPYFWVSNTSNTDLLEDEWMLIVGHVYPSGHPGTTRHPDSGRYTTNAGFVGNTSSDFAWLPQTSTSIHRAYTYYSTDVNVKQQFVYPRVDLVDGDEPSIDDLLNGFDINNGLGTGASYEWFTGSCGGTSIGTGENITVTPTTTTTYYVQASGNCNTTACESVTVTVNNPPAASVTNDGNITCADANSTMTALPAGMTYAWSGGGTGQTKTVTSLGTYTVTVTDSNGCTDSAQTTVGENITPTNIYCERYRIYENGAWGAWTNFSGNCDIYLCENDGLSDFQFDGGPNFDTGWVWKDEDGITDAEVDEIVTFSNIGANDAGTYTGVYTNEYGCISNISFNVIVNPNPDAAATSNGPLTCALTTVTMTATPAGMIYAWSSGGTNQSETTTIPGTYTVTVTDSNGCSDTAETIVTEDVTDPTAAAGPDDEICLGESATLTASGGGTYAWSHSAGNTASVTVTPTVTTTYTVTVTLANGCTDTDDVIVTVVNNFTNPGTIGSDESFCGPYDPQEITNITLPSGGNDGVTYYAWQKREFDCNTESYGPWSWLGINTISYDPTLITVTTQYRRTAQRTAGCSPSWVYSAVVTKEVVEQYSGAGTIAGGNTQCGPYDPALITSTVDPIGGCSGTEETRWYKWERNCSTGSWGSGIYIPGATSHSYDPPAISVSTRYRRYSRRSPDCSSTVGSWLVSNIIYYYVEEGPNSGGTISADQDNCGSFDPAILTGDASTGCSSETIAYQWQYRLGTSGTFIDIANTDSKDYDPPAATETIQYRRKVSTGICGDSFSSIVTITVFTPLVASASNDGPITCADPTVTLTAMPAGMIYAWSGGGTGQTKNVTAPGTYTVTVTDANGCSDIASTTVVETITPPNAGATNDGPLTCANTSVILTATSTTPNATFAWSGGGSNATKTVTDPGTYTVTVTDPTNGCTTTAQTIVIQNNTPTPIYCERYRISRQGLGWEPWINFNGNCDIVICEDDGLTNIQFDGGPDINTGWVWTDEDGNIDAEVDEIVQFVDIGFNDAGTYTGQLTDANGCISTLSFNVIVNQNPIAAVTSNGPLTCALTTVTMTATPAGMIYAWSGGGTAQTKTTSLPGTYTVTVTDTNGCSDTASVIVTQDDTEPTVTVNSPDICIGESTSLTATGGGTYAWPGSLSGATITVSPNTTTDYIVTVTSANGCTGTATATVTVNPLPDSGIIVWREILCAPAPGYIYATQSYPNAINTLDNASIVTGSAGCGSKHVNMIGTSPNAYFTENLDNAVSAGNTYDFNFKYKSTGPGLFRAVIYYYDASWGYLSGSVQSFPVAGTWTDGTVSLLAPANAINVQIRFLISDNNTADIDCLEFKLQGSGASIYTEGFEGSMPYQWSGPNGFTGIGRGIYITEPGTYNLTVTDPNTGCTAVNSTVVNEYTDPPNAGASNDGPLTCTNTTVNLTATSTTPGATFAWSGGGTSATKTVTDPGTYTVTVTDPSNGCTETAQTIVLQDISAPTADAGANSGICFGESIELTATGGGTYLWSNSGGTNASFTVNPTTTTTYTVTVTDPSNGCTDEASVTITVNPLPTVTVSTTDATCELDNGTATAVPSGGTGPYTYDWSLQHLELDFASVVGNKIPSVMSLDSATNINGTLASGYITLDDSDDRVQLPNHTIHGLDDFEISIDFYMTSINGLNSLFSAANTSQNNALLIAYNNNTNFNIYMMGTTVSYATSTLVVNQWYTVKITRIGDQVELFLDGSSLGTKTMNSTAIDSDYACLGEEQDSVDGGYDANQTLEGRIDNVIVKRLYQDDSATLTGLAPGIVTVTITDANGCSATDSGVINELPTIIASASNNGPVTCLLPNVTLTALPAGLIYAWSGGGSNQTKSVSAAGTYTVTVTDSNGCTSTAQTIVIEENTTPNAGATNDGPLTCANTTVTLTASSTTNGATYAWSGGGTNATKTVTDPGTYTVTVTDPSNGCTTTAQTIVIQNNTPTPIFCQRYRFNHGGTWGSWINFSGNCEIELCEDDGLTDIQFDGGPDINTGWVWKDENGNIDPEVDEMVVFDNIGLDDAGTYTGELTNSDGCVSNLSFEVIVNPNPMAAATSNGPLTCALTTATMTATPAGMTYSWSSGGTAQTETTTLPGTYTVTVTDTDGCTDSASVIVTQDATIPNVSASNDGPLTCANTTVTLTASSTTNGATYAWSSGGTNATKTVTDPGTYTVTVTDPSNGCTETAQTIVVQNITSPNAVANTDEAICPNGTTIVSATANGGSGVGYIYDWDNGLGNGASHSVTINGTTDYIVTVTDSNGCTDTDIVTISVVPAPQVSITVQDATICAGETATITSTVNGGTGSISYQWQRSAKGFTWVDIAGANASSYTTPTLSSTTYYRLVVSYTGVGCDDIISTVSTVVVEIPSTVVSAFADPVEICIGASATLTVNESSVNGGEIDNSTWAVGTGSTTGYEKVGATAENNRINDVDPWGNTTVVWESQPDAESGSDGGFNTSKFDIDNTKLYRFSIWVNRKVLGIDGKFYLGTKGYGSTNGLKIVTSGNSSTNPYFWVSNHGAPELLEDEWVLVVGHIFPSGHAGTSLHPDSGRYTTNAGYVGANALDFAWLPQTTESLLRSFLYYTTDTSVRQQIVYPRVDIVDGNEPSINDLLNGFDSNNGLGTGATYEWFTGSCGGTLVGTGESITVTPTTTTTYYVRATGDCNTTACESVTVTVNNPPPAAAINDGPLTCADTEAILTATPSGLNYSWSTNETTETITVSSTGTYTVTVTDANGCLATASTTVTEDITSPIANAGADQDICELETVTLTATGGGTYQWSHSAGNTAVVSVNPTSSTTYTVTVTATNGCTGTDQVEVVVNENPTNPGSIAGDESLCGAYTPTVITSVGDAWGGAGSPIEYQWQKRDYDCNTASFGAWVDIVSATENWYSPGAISTTTEYRRLAGHLGCPSWIVSNVVTKEVVINKTDPGTIAANQSGCESFDPELITGTPATGGCGGTVEHQWQVRPLGGTWSDIPGATGLNYDPPTISETTEYQRLVRSLPCPFVASNIVIMTINEASFTAVALGSNLDCDGNCTGTIDVVVDHALTGDYMLAYTFEGNGIQVGPFTQDSATITSLCAGSYSNITVISTETSCTDTWVGNVSISESHADWEHVTLTSDVSDCHASTCDGSFTIDANLGVTGAFTASYEYNGNTIQLGPYTSAGDIIIDGLCAGTYSDITITSVESGCTDVWPDDIVISTPDFDAIVLNSVDDDCQINEGSVTVRVTNGVYPYTIEWRNEDDTESGTTILNQHGNVTIYGLTGGSTYCFKVTDSNGCTEN